MKKLRATKGNLGVQVFRRSQGGIAHFTTTPKDKYYLLELPPYVEHHDVLVDECN